MYWVKINKWSKDPKIHKEGCGHIKKRGGKGIANQVEWEKFDTFEEAEVHVKKWVAKGHKNNYYCGFCMKDYKLR